MIPSISNLFEPLENAIRQRLIPAITEKSSINDIDREIFALPTHVGGLNLQNPVNVSNIQFLPPRGQQKSSGKLPSQSRSVVFPCIRVPLETPCAGVTGGSHLFCPLPTFVVMHSLLITPSIATWEVPHARLSHNSS